MHKRDFGVSVSSILWNASPSRPNTFSDSSALSCSRYLDLLVMQLASCTDIFVKPDVRRYRAISGVETELVAERNGIDVEAAETPESEINAKVCRSSSRNSHG